MVVLSTIYRN